MSRRNATIVPTPSTHIERDIDAMLRKSQPGHFDGEQAGSRGRTGCLRVKIIDTDDLLPHVSPAAKLGGPGDEVRRRRFGETARIAEPMDWNRERTLRKALCTGKL